MKNHLVYLLLSCGILLSCAEEKRAQIEQLEAENLEIRSELRAKDSVLLNFMESISNIEKNLVLIREREMNISLQNREIDPEDAVAHQKRILSDIKAIDQLIVENKGRISKLNALLSEAKSDNNGLRSLMEDMKKGLEHKIQEQEDAIASLKAELGARTSDVVGLMADVEILREEKEELREKLTDELNAAYYLIGDFKDLKDKAILEKRGGLLGIGRSTVLQDNFSTSHFQEVDIREISTLPLEAKKVEFITTHDASSYVIEPVNEDDEKLLVISDPEKFWEKSSYLVVLTKN